MRPILCVVLISIVVCGDCFGMTWETFGPARGLGRGWGEQPGWAAGLVDVLGHDSRVYSIWVNGNENYYFDARPEQVKELIDGYSKIRLRDHVIRIVEEGGQRKSRVGRLIEFTVQLHVLSGFALYESGKKLQSSHDTFEPVLTVFLGGLNIADFLEKVEISGHVIVRNEISGAPLVEGRERPERLD